MKYRLTDEKKEWCGYILHRIEAVKDFADVKAGEKGGWIEQEENLSQEDNCWVYDNARVCDNAEVYDNARVRDNAWVCGDARVCGDAKVCNNARVYGNARVCDNAKVYGNAEVCDNAWVCNNANIFWCSNIGSRHATTTMFRNKDNGITVTCGCFMGTLEEFAAIVEKEHGENIFGKEYKLLIELAKIHFGLQDETKRRRGKWHIESRLSTLTQTK